MWTLVCHGRRCGDGLLLHGGSRRGPLLLPVVLLATVDLRVRTLERRGRHGGDDLLLRGGSRRGRVPLPAVLPAAVDPRTRILRRCGRMVVTTASSRWISEGPFASFFRSFLRMDSMVLWRSGGSDGL